MRLVLTLLALLIPASVRAQSPMEEGHVLVQKFCAPCHATTREGKSPRADAPPFSSLAGTFDLDEFPQLLERGISSGHPDMPQFKFSQDDARAVRDYLRTIQR